MSARILAFGDLHLGAGHDRLDDQAAVLDRIVDLALDREVDAVCFAGDATHHRSAIQEVAVFQSGLARLNKERIPVLLIPGNHDVSAMGADSTVEVAARGFEWCSVARTPGLLGWALDVQVFALPWCPTSAIAALDPTGQVDDVAHTAQEILTDIARGLRAQVKGTDPAVLMLHWSLAGSVTPTGALTDEFREVVLPTREFAEMGWSAVIASHIHTAGMVIEAPQPIFYTGSACTVDFGEEGTAHGAWILEVAEGETTRAEFCPLPDRPFLTVPFLVEQGHVQRCHEFTGAIVRVRYEATADQERLIDHEAIKAELLALGVHRVHSIEPSIVGQSSTRTAITEEVDVDQALAMWLDGQEVDDTSGVLDTHHEIREAVR